MLAINLVTISYIANDGLALSGGLLIISIAITVHRARKYMESRMSDPIESTINTKAPIIASISGGVVTLSTDHIISLFGLIVAVAGIVIAILQYRESRRKNNLAEKELNWKMEHANAAKKREVEENNR